MNFTDLKLNDVIQIMHSDNTVELETISNIGSNSGMINLSFSTSNMNVKVLPNESIYFDEIADVVCFTTKHRLINH